MKILDVLHKLGILRFGSKGGTYKSYKDMPDELMFDNVYNKKTDLVDKDDRKKVKGLLKSKDEKHTSKNSSLLFFALMIISAIITFFFSLIISFNFWIIALLGILIVFFFKLYGYKKGLYSIKFIWTFFVVYLIISIIILFVAIPNKDQPASVSSGLANKNKSTKNDYSAKVENESEWIDYAGEKSSAFTFRYPKSYLVEESGTSTLVFVDKSKDYDYHITYSMVDGDIPVSKDCEQLAKNILTGFKNGELRYAKTLTLEGLTGCEYGINIEQNDSKIFEITYNFISNKKTFYITAYAKQLSDLDVLLKIMQSFKLK
ncbi:MAG: hypothetical protein WAV31_02355 [Candidatus Moraniibacteriota bacterium]